MNLERTAGALHKLGERLFGLIEQLAGTRPQLSSGWYKARALGTRKAFLWLRFVGNQRRRYPANSVHLSAEWHDPFDVTGVKELTKGWYGRKSSAALSVCPSSREELKAAELYGR
jgi:hypothetical protein